VSSLALVHVCGITANGTCLGYVQTNLPFDLHNPNRVIAAKTVFYPACVPVFLFLMFARAVRSSL